MTKLRADDIIKTALAIGLDDCNVVKVHHQDEDAAFMDQWVAAGNHGTMSYFERNQALRYNPAVLVPGAQYMAVCLLTYRHSGHDYHRTMKSKLYALEAALTTYCEQVGIVRKIPSTQHIFCDSAPMLERRWAVEAGLGFIGRNHQLISPSLGSMVHIGELVLADEVTDLFDRQCDRTCGTCKRCIEACPGQALGHDEWNAQRCVAYVTHRCFVCQDVCPMNSMCHRDHNEEKV